MTATRQTTTCARPNARHQSVVTASFRHPYAVFEIDDDPRDALQTAGEFLSNHETFPDRCNIEFVRPICTANPRHYGLRARGGTHARLRHGMRRGSHCVCPSPPVTRANHRNPCPGRYAQSGRSRRSGRSSAPDWPRNPRVYGRGLIFGGPACCTRPGCAAMPAAYAALLGAMAMPYAQKNIETAGG